MQLLAFAQKYKDRLRHYWNFFGRFYTYYADKGELKLESLWPSFEQKLNKVYAKHEVAAYAVLRAYIELRHDYDTWSACDYNRLEYRARELAGKGWKRALVALEVEGIVDKRASGRRPGERSIPLELIPLVERVLPNWTIPSVLLESGDERKTTILKNRKEIWDLFICHASEDKDEVARPLAKMLSAEDLKVWYDNFTLTLGDSLRRSIDFGLARSRYGVVILSPSFFKKDWPQRELDGLTARERNGVKVILPVWHNVDRDFVLQYSPILADRLAVSTGEGLDKVVEEILKAVGSKTTPREQRENEAPLASIDKDTARELLQRQIEVIPGLKAKKHASPDFEPWRRQTLRIIKRIFGGDSDNAKQFDSIFFYPLVVTSSTPESEYQEVYEEGLTIAETTLRSFINELDLL